LLQPTTARAQATARQYRAVRISTGRDGFSFPPSCRPLTVSGIGNDTAHLANTAQAAKAALHADKLEAVANRGYFDGEEILSCDRAGITVTLPKRMTSGAKSEGRFGKQDFVYLADENVYRCPAGEKLKYRFTAEENGQKLYRYWTDACHTCMLDQRVSRPCAKSGHPSVRRVLRDARTCMRSFGATEMWTLVVLTATSDILSGRPDADPSRHNNAEG